MTSSLHSPRKDRNVRVGLVVVPLWHGRLVSNLGLYSLLLQELDFPVLRNSTLLFELLYRKRFFTAWGRSQTVTPRGPEVERCDVEGDLHHDNNSQKRSPARLDMKFAKFTLLSHIATELTSHLNRT
jgi:hypothetical protein